MSSNGNGGGDGELSVEQRARMSQRFRAAKALLSRKRPLESTKISTPFKLKNGHVETPARFTSGIRDPLLEISLNAPSPVFVKGLNGSGNKFGNKFYSEVVCGGSTTGVRRNDGFVTPTKQLEVLSSNDNFNCGNMLEDDEFDESVFEQIDALCRQSTALKDSSGQVLKGSHIGEDLSCVVPMVGEEICNAESILNAVDGIKNKVGGIESKSMPEEYSNYLKSLNDRQQEAACSDISIPLMIAAGPGSGKTSTMVGRILMLLNEGIGASHILAMTFTTAAASEMRDRIGSVAGKAIAKELIISTFHSFALQLCRLHADKLERTPEFLIFGHGQQRRAIIEVVRIFENEKNVQKQYPGNFDEDLIGNCPKQFKDKSKKWQKFVTQAKAFWKDSWRLPKRGR